MARYFLPALGALLTACSGPGTSSAPVPSVLRVSTSYGLEPISAAVESGATRNLLDLVYEPGKDHFSGIEAMSSEWRLIARPGQGGNLAAKIRHPRLVAARDDGKDVVVTVRGDLEPTLDEFFVDLGPFEQETFTPEQLVLRRRGDVDPQRLVFVACGSEDEEWRRFLARDVDLSPTLPGGVVDHLREVPSVRIAPYRQRQTYALHFAASSPTFHDAVVRRNVAARINRPAIARFVTGDPGNAVSTHTHDTGELLRGEVRLIFHEGAFDVRRAVLVVEQQLLEMGLEVRVEALDVAALAERLQSRRFDAFVFYGGHDPKNAAFLTTGSVQNLSGYSNREFDAAIERKEFERAQEILEQDVPLTPLYSDAQYVAVDRRFCNLRPLASYDYKFLADIRPCEPGETE